MPQLSQEPEGGSVREALKRYARLEEAEVRALRDALEGFPEEEARMCQFGDVRVIACNKLLEWHPEAKSWNWERILSESNQREYELPAYGHALYNSLLSDSNESLREVLLRADAYLHLDTDEVEGELRKWTRGQEQDPTFEDALTAEEGLVEDHDGYDTTYNELDNLGWPGIREGTREGLKKLAEAIHWAALRG
ncbi:hypothetical protein GGP91_003334 [Salinibacter ruber]|uniref:hypothetical protein n=1 Tax=Salinibacter ruber TaxID=146919 RepID=UPI002168DC17|nr:hypothetical protein [Salinibacter ruber]MCS3831233.1 hypothetical protein [Salinibacter ruber]